MHSAALVAGLRGCENPIDFHRCMEYCVGLGGNVCVVYVPCSKIFVDVVGMGGEWNVESIVVVVFVIAGD